MARKLQRLSVKTIQSKREPGYYADGGGLYLQVSQPKAGRAHRVPLSPQALTLAAR